MLRVVRSHPRCPELSVAVMRTRHIGVMVAGDGCHLPRRAKLLQPKPRVLKFLTPGEVRQVAGDSDVMRLVGLQVRDEPAECFPRECVLAVLPPVGVADDALG